jgi:hypothetical protein
VDAGQFGSRRVEPPVPCARRDQELLIAELFARRERDRVLIRIHRDDRGFEPLHVVLGVPVRRPDVPAAEILLRAEIRLRQGRATEGDPWFGADEHDPALEALLAERHRGVAAGEAGAGDHERLVTAHAMRSGGSASS